jgi:hypothetical protein
MCMQKSRERGRYLVFFDELSSLLTVKNANRHDNGCLPPGELHLNHGADKSSLQEGAGRQSADGGPFNHDTGKRLGEGQAGRVPRRPVQQEQHRVEIVLTWVVDSHHPPPRKISRLTRSKTPRRRRASPGDWCDLHTNRHPAARSRCSRQRTRRTFCIRATAWKRTRPFASAFHPPALALRACCPAADERLGFRVTHWRLTPADGPHRAVVIARVGSLGCAFSALPSRAIHCPLRLLIDDEPSHKKAAEGRMGPRRRRHRRGREPHDEDEGKRGHRQRSHARRTPHSASVCVADRQTWQVACQEAVKKGLSAPPSNARAVAP